MLSDTDTYQEGDKIDGKYEVIERIGRGGYGEIYVCYAKQLEKKDEKVAVKIERAVKPGNLTEEINILQRLIDKGVTTVPTIHGTGKYKDNLNYFAMELLGENLSTLRKEQEYGRFSMLTTTKLAIQMINCLKQVHNAGILHRDVKPGNFVLGTEYSRNGPRSVYIIDFGLSQSYVEEDGTLKAKKKSARWVGSRRYMSINTHLRKDQGRRDDMWSLLYVLIEFVTGNLPWGYLRGIDNLCKVRDMKIQCCSERLTRGLPNEFLEFLIHLKTLKFASKPNYDHLIDLFQKLHDSLGGTEDTPFDWEKKVSKEEKSEEIIKYEKSVKEQSVITHHQPKVQEDKGRCLMM